MPMYKIILDKRDNSEFIGGLIAQLVREGVCFTAHESGNNFIIEFSGGY